MYVLRQKERVPPSYLLMRYIVIYSAHFPPHSTQGHSDKSPDEKSPRRHSYFFKQFILPESGLNVRLFFIWCDILLAEEHSIQPIFKFFQIL